MAQAMLYPEKLCHAADMVKKWFIGGRRGVRFWGSDRGRQPGHVGKQTNGRRAIREEKRGAKRETGGLC